MSARPPLPPGPYLVVGLARSGAAAVEVLRAHGEVLGTDAGHPPGAESLGIETAVGSDGLELLGRARTVIKSPGVPAQAPVVAAARERGLPVLGELELAWRLLPNPFAAVTGTNGKTTTVELLGAIHRAAGIPVAVAGNVGTALTTLVGRLQPEAVVACEASSFQLEDSDGFAPEAALLLNISADHLDRHGTLAAYRDAKLRIFAHQEPEDVAVLPAAFEAPPRGRGRLVRFGPAEGELTVAGGSLRWHGDEVMPTAEIRLRGSHNLENAMGAAAVALAREVPAAAVREALATFAGVAHRLEEVADRDGVLFVNDSKATNPDSARVGIGAFRGGVHVILGGILKGGGFTDLREPLSTRCRAAYLIGQAADRLAEDLAGTVPLHRCGGLERAVAAAAAAAEPGDVVLLSPACASWDQYRDFEERGEHFRALAERVGSAA